MKEILVMNIPDDTGYWLLRANGGKYYDDFFNNNYVAISDNNILVSEVNELNNESLLGLTIEQTKQLYEKKYSSWSNHQISHAANRTYRFFSEIKVGDIVIVPSKRSQYFLLGIIESDVYELQEDDEIIDENTQYSICPYKKRRKVKWLKEVLRLDISEKLYWVLFAHQTIFDLQNDKEYINQLLSPLYIHNHITHGVIKISKKEGLTSDDWYEFHSSIKKISDKSKEDLVIKSNVQSPGIIEFLSSDPKTVAATVLFLSGILVGDVNFLGIKVKGIIPYIQSHKRKKIEIDILEEEKLSKKLDNERKRFELDKEKEEWEKEKRDEAVIKERLQISMFDAGKLIEDQTQKDNSENPYSDES